MDIASQYESLSEAGSRRETIKLVSRMMRYRMDMMYDLEDELCHLVEVMFSRGNQRRLRSNARRFHELTGRIGQLVSDTQYDTVQLQAILPPGETGKDSQDDGDSEVRYIT